MALLNMSEVIQKFLTTLGREMIAEKGPIEIVLMSQN